jgi:hypothetical protein
MASSRRDQTDYWNLILQLILILIALVAMHTTRLIPSVEAVEWNYGENQEVCDTEQTIPDAIIHSNSRPADRNGQGGICSLGKWENACSPSRSTQ